MTVTYGPSQSADLVIVGAGGAGMTAAAAALESGLEDILALEKGSSWGGNTVQSAGMFAVGSPAQKRKGIEVPVEDIFREKMEYANWRVDPRLARVCIEKSGEIVQWLENKGMRFDNVIEFLREGEAPQVFHSFRSGDGELRIAREEPGDVVRAALFPASESSDFVTGQLLVVDGGAVFA
jgi:fumarate reductase flavoprotein subunit